MDLRDQLQTTLGDAYTLDRELGGGGMSRVFVAKETALSRSVVVKVLPPETGGQVSIERFRREIALAAGLQHPHIVPVLTAGMAGELLYFTMPYVRGESLRASLSQHGELPVAGAVRILREVASALAFAHANGVVHRDVKPDNILVSGDAVMVTDFGVAKALSESTTTGDSGLTSVGVALGTPAYMSPEQVTADRLTDHRTDIYSWGVLAYELLSGATPFHGRPAQAMLVAHVQETPEPLDRRRAGLPGDLTALVMRCLAKRPADRPQTARDLVAALDRVVITDHSTARRPIRQRSRTLTAMIIGAVIAAGGAAAAVLYTKDGVTGRAMPGSIAVLPCTNASRDSSRDHLSEGMSDELRTALNRVDGLSVKARSSSVIFRNTSLDSRRIGDSLDVGAVLQCEVSWPRDRVHVNADLVNVADGNSLWAETIDSDSAGFETVRDSILRSLLAKLQLPSGGSSPAHSENREAMDLYRRGRYAQSKSTEPDLRRALVLYDSALALDPRLADAHAGIAWSWAFLADAYVSPAEAYPRTKVAARRAVDLDSANASAVAMQAMASAFLDWDYTEAERLYRHSLRLHDRDADVHAAFGTMLCFEGRVEEGLAETDKAIALDPLAAIDSWFRELCLIVGGRYREAIDQTRHTHAIDPKWFYAESGDGYAYRELGKLDSSIVAYQRDSTFAGVAPYGLAISYARDGRPSEARRVIAGLEQQYRARYYPPDFIAVAYAALGEMDRAYEWLGRAVEKRSSMWFNFRAGPEWTAIRKDSRWEGLARRVRPRR